MIEAWSDHARRRVVVAMTGDVSGPDYVTWLVELLSAEPVLRGYDFIYDLQGYGGRISHDDIAGLAPRYAALVGDLDRGAVTVLVTQDEGFRFWVELFRIQFPNRSWHVVSSLEAAERMLDAPRG